jgi:hypothetical protein
LEGKTRRKLLKTGKLAVYQFGAKMPSFRQATDWPKMGNTLGQRTQNLQALRAARG